MNMFINLDTETTFIQISCVTIDGQDFDISILMWQHITHEDYLYLQTRPPDTDDMTIIWSDDEAMLTCAYAARLRYNQEVDLSLMLWDTFYHEAGDQFIWDTGQPDFIL